MISRAFTFTTSPFAFARCDGAVSFGEFIKVLIAYMALDDDASGDNSNDRAFGQLRLRKNLIRCEWYRLLLSYIKMKWKLGSWGAEETTSSSSEQQWTENKRAKTIESFPLSVLEKLRSCSSKCPRWCEIYCDTSDSICLSFKIKARSDIPLCGSITQTKTKKALKTSSWSD